VPWALSAKVQLPPGRYTVAVIAVDTHGRAGGRRGRFNRRSFSVR
jgi:hypothetical protein